MNCSGKNCSEYVFHSVMYDSHSISAVLDYCWKYKSFSKIIFILPDSHTENIETEYLK
jgi:hypothetical protein